MGVSRVTRRGRDAARVRAASSAGMTATTYASTMRTHRDERDGMAGTDASGYRVDGQAGTGSTLLFR